MATYLHFAPALALAAVMMPKNSSIQLGWRWVVAGCIAAVLPDLDMIAVWLRWVAYNQTYGHRGFTHSVGFALLMGLAAALVAGKPPQTRLMPKPRAHLQRRLWVGGYIGLCTLSHPLIDGLFDVGICNAWAWPLDGARHCLPWRPIPMQGVPLFGDARLLSELLWIALPLCALVVIAKALPYMAKLVYWWGVALGYRLYSHLRPWLMRHRSAKTARPY